MSTTHPPLFRTTMSSPIGLLTLVANDRGLVAIRWDTETDGSEPDAHNPVDAKLGDEFVDVPTGQGGHATLDQALDCLFRIIDLRQKSIRLFLGQQVVVDDDAFEDLMRRFRHERLLS